MGINRVGRLAVVMTDGDDNRSCRVLFNKVIRPTIQQGQWYDLQTSRSGITEEDYRNGIPYEVAILEVKDLLRDATVVGHDIKHEFRALDLPMYPTAHCVFDTATNASLNALVPSERGKQLSKLAGLAHTLLGETIQQAIVHDLVEDASAALRIYLNNVDLQWEPLGDPDSMGTLPDGRTFRLP